MPSQNVPIPANGYVTDAQFVGFTYPTCLGSNDHHSYTQNFSVTVGGVNYNLSTTVSISNGNFNGTPQDNVNITTPWLRWANMRTSLPFSPVVLLAAALLLSLRVSGQAAPAPQDDVLTRPARIGDRSLPAFSAFESALQVSVVPGGVAFVEGCPDQTEPMVHPRGNNLREALDSITSGDPRYVWRMHNGVVNLEPLKGVPALLKMHLKTYDSQDTDAVSAVTFLSSSSVVARAAAELGLTHNVLGPGLGGMAQGPPPPKNLPGVRLHDVTLLDALNAIARANKHGVWIYRETRCGSIHQFNLSFAQ